MAVGAERLKDMDMACDGHTSAQEQAAASCSTDIRGVNNANSQAGTATAVSEQKVPLRRENF